MYVLLLWWGERWCAVRSLLNAACTLFLAGAGTSLLAGAALVGTVLVRQAARATPVHPAGVAAGLIALFGAFVCGKLARARLDRLGDGSYRTWSIREG
jgi:hypothetical protein